MAETTSKMNPLFAAAAVAVIIFSGVGVGVMTGFIPSSKSSADVQVQEVAGSATAPAVKTEAAPEAKAPPVQAQKAPVQKQASAPKHKPQQVAVNEQTVAPPPPPAARVCNECGVIDSINVVDKKGDGSGLGAVGGAVVGGLLGNQVGGGRGKTAATVVGVVGGALAGNEVEKRVKSVNEYQVTVRMNDGTSRNFTFDTAPGYVVGEKIKVIDGRIVRG